jgi:hypothetical protein
MFNIISYYRNDDILLIENKKSNKLFLTTDKIELPSKFLAKMELDSLQLSNLNGKNSFGDFLRKFKNTFLEYYLFFKHFLKDKYNFVEILYILRPIIYLGLMLFFNSKKTIIPILINLVLDIIILKFKRQEPSFSKQKVFSHEYVYRVGKMAVYLLREPIFSVITKPFILRILRILRLPNFVVTIVQMILRYYTLIYFIM